MNDLPTIAKMCTDDIIFHFNRFIIVSILLVFWLTNPHPEKSIFFRTNERLKKNNTKTTSSLINDFKQKYHFMVHTKMASRPNCFSYWTDISSINESVEDIVQFGQRMFYSYTKPWPKTLLMIGLFQKRAFSKFHKYHCDAQK